MKLGAALAALFGRLPSESDDRMRALDKEVEAAEQDNRRALVDLTRVRLAFDPRPKSGEDLRKLADDVDQLDSQMRDALKG